MPETTYTFRDAGLRSPALRAMNFVGGVLSRVGFRRPSLDPDALVGAAIQEAGVSDFGSESFREPLERYVESVEAEADLTTFGRMAVAGMIVQSLATRLRLQEWCEAYPENREQQIVRPWIIVGLPRTGTSLLSILLGLDPMVRPLRQWEARSPAPPSTLATANDDPRIAECQKGLDQLAKLNPPFRAMHPFGAMLPEECVPFFMLDLRTLGLETQAYVPSYGRWLESCDMAPAYVQHQKALRALQWGQPTESWVLKTPNHLWALETLLSFYPDARLIWTHRDPGPVVTSVASLNVTLQRTFTDRCDPLRVGAEWKHKLRHAVDRGMAYDDAAPSGWCVHVAYEDLMRDAVGTVRRIYAHFDQEPTRLHERRVEAWLRDRPQEAFGRHAYDPADFGWSYAQLAEEFSDYRDRYQVDASSAA
jgi:hypothetical protein